MKRAIGHNRDLDIAGVDLLFAGDHFKVCEANSSPGFQGLEKCCGINVSKEIFHFIRVRLGLFASQNDTKEPE